MLNAVGEKPEGSPDPYAVGLSVSGYYGFTLVSYGGGDLLQYRRANNADWKTIAFTDSNVASATKLQTARTIWGQSFDGSANVSGEMIGVRRLRFNSNNNYGIFLYGPDYNSALTSTDIVIYATKTVINQKSKYNKDFITEIYKNSL